MGTHWEQEKKQKSLSHTSPSPPKEKKNWTPHECMLSLHIGLMKLFVTIFGMG